MKKVVNLMVLALHDDELTPIERLFVIEGFITDGRMKITKKDWQQSCDHEKVEHVYKWIRHIQRWQNCKPDIVSYEEIYTMADHFFKNATGVTSFIHETTLMTYNEEEIIVKMEWNNLFNERRFWMTPTNVFGTIEPGQNKIAYTQLVEDPVVGLGPSNNPNLGIITFYFSESIAQQF